MYRYFTRLATFALFLVNIALVPFSTGAHGSATIASGLQTSGYPELPRIILNTTYVPPSGPTINVSAGGNLQLAINIAQPGSIIVLAPGATYSGNFDLPKKAGTGWIVIRSGAPDASLPPQGTRATPSYAAHMPKIVTPNSEPAIQTAAGAHHYRFIGVEFAIASGVDLLYNLIAFDAGKSTASQTPNNLIIDRCYVHGNTTGNARRGLAMNSASTAVIDSYFANFKEDGADSQAIAGWNGPGPFKIVNNYLEGAAENFLLGGADPDIKNLIPSDVEFRRNHVFKPLSWKVDHPSYAGLDWVVKNLFELKNAQRVLIEGNIFENNWGDAQDGMAILFTPRNQDGGSPWSVVQDVTFINNILRHSGGGFNISGPDNEAGVSEPARRILIRNNLIEDIDGARFGSDQYGPADGEFLQIVGGPQEIKVEHNTFFQTGNIATVDGAESLGFVYRDNLGPNNDYGVIGSEGAGIRALTAYLPGAIFTRNVIVGGFAVTYPADNFRPTDFGQVGFVNQAASDYRLSSSSPYRNAGSDGRDIGTDITTLNAAVAGVIVGTGGSGGTSDTTSPIVELTEPEAEAIVSGTVILSADASDNVGVVGVQFRLDGTALGSEDTTPPYSVSWNTTSVLNGTHTLDAIARGAAGNAATSTPRTVTVINADTTAPSAPVGVVLTGATSAALTMNWNGATDNIGVTGYRIDVSASSSFASFVSGYNNRDVGNALMFGVTGLAAQTTYYARVRAYDSAGNVSSNSAKAKASTNATPDRTPPSIHTVAATGITKSGATITWSTTEAADTQVEFGTSTAYGTSSLLNTALVTNHSETLSGLLAGTVYQYQVTSRDAAGNLGVSPNFSFTTAAAPPPPGGAQPAVWILGANLKLTGNTMTKTGGCDGCQATAISQQSIRAVNGYVEFVATETNKERHIGLITSGKTVSLSNLEYAIELGNFGSVAGVRERGAYRTETSYKSGDVFRIATENGVVKYFKNGGLWYTSTKALTGTVIVGVSIVNINGSIRDAVILASAPVNPVYAGTLDEATCEGLSGWVADGNRPNVSLAVDIYDGNQLIVSNLPATQSRPDVGAYLGDNGSHGFSVSTPSVLLDGKPHSLWVKIAGTNVPLSWSNPRTLTCTPVAPSYLGHFDGASCQILEGWFADTNRPNVSLEVDIYDGSQLIVSYLPANESRPDVGAYLGDNGSHGFRIPTPTELLDGGTHTIWIKIAGTNIAWSNPRSLTCP